MYNFLFDTDQNSTFSLLSYVRLMQFSYTKTGNFPDDFISLNEIRNTDTLRLATFMTILCFRSSDVIFTQFPDDFLTWARCAIFMGWIFCIFWVPYEKTDSPINAACFPWPEATNIWKSQKIDVHKKWLTQKFCDGIMWWFVLWHRTCWCWKPRLVPPSAALSSACLCYKAIRSVKFLTGGEAFLHQCWTVCWNFASC